MFHSYGLGPASSPQLPGSFFTPSINKENLLIAGSLLVAVNHLVTVNLLITESREV